MSSFGGTKTRLQVLSYIEDILWHSVHGRPTVRLFIYVNFWIIITSFKFKLIVLESQAVWLSTIYILIS